MQSRTHSLGQLAASQDGQFATRQAVAQGFSRHALRHLRQRGQIEAVRLGVWRFTSTPGTADPAVAAYLACWPDGVVSHRSAGRHHGLRRIEEQTEVDVTVDHGMQRRLDGVRVHVSRHIPSCDVLNVGGVRYTALARTVCDLADPRAPWETLALLDEAVALGASHAWIHHRAAELAMGRGGLVLLRDATSADAAAVFRSWLERASQHVLRVSGIPEPEWNVPVRDGQGRIGVVDALWRSFWVVVEMEGLRFHTSPARRRADAKRFNRLGDAGYVSRRFTWEDVVNAPVEVAASVMRALRSAGADLDPARIPGRIDVPGGPFSGRW